MAIIHGFEMPEELYYHKDHTWVRLEEDGTVTVGMTDFYGKTAGDTTYVDLPDVDDDVEQGETAGKIQSAKWVGKLVSPVTGEVVEINEDLEDDFMLLNTDPYVEGWIMRIAPADLDEDMKGLMHGEAALSEFLASELDANKDALSGIEG